MTARTYFAKAWISGFWRHLGSLRVLAVHAEPVGSEVRLRVSATLDLAKTPISGAQVYAAFASLSSWLALGSGAGRATSGFTASHFASLVTSWDDTSLSFCPTEKGSLA